MIRQLLLAIALIFTMAAAAQRLRADDAPTTRPATRPSEADLRWRTARNLIPNSTFDTVKQWMLIQPRRDGSTYLTLADDLPRYREAAIYRQPLGEGKTRNLLAMYLDARQTRQKEPLCESDPIRIAPGLQYRLQLQYRTSGPGPSVHIGAYASVLDKEGKPTLEQVQQWSFGTPSPTLNQWETLTGEFAIQRTDKPVSLLKIQLGGQGRTGGYLHFDDLQLKGIGRAPATQPAE